MSFGLTPGQFSTIVTGRIETLVTHLSTGPSEP
jgi:hypothetical protein